MILVTGGAGFIGSNLNAALAEAGHEVAVVDQLGQDGKWRNLAAHPPACLVRPDGLERFLATNPPLDMVFHLGAISATTATDGDLVWRTNVDLSLTLWHWCAAHGVRFVYASSAATYGDGAAGFEDDIDALHTLKPRNLYGWSKHAFDLQVAKMLRAGAQRPPQWAGLKLFNVYGPNEYHKGPMISVVKVKHDDVLAGHAPKLFRSDRARAAGRRADARLHLGRRRGGRHAVAAGLARRERPVQRRHRQRPFLPATWPKRCAAPPRCRNGRSSSTCRRRCAVATSPSPRPAPRGCAPPGYPGQFTQSLEDGGPPLRRGLPGLGADPYR